MIGRLDKLLSVSGMSRTDAKKAVAAGRVYVDGVRAKDAAMKADSASVTLDGAPIEAEDEIYLMINKPAGVITATEDKHLPTVVSLLPPKYAKRKIGPVGRLDRDVTGLVILTTNGELAHRLISPKWKAEKCYRAVCEGRLTEKDVAAFASGMELSDFTAKPAGLDIVTADDERSEALVTLTEGKFHQVKRMFIAVGHPLTSLRRERIGTLTLDETLAEGEYRPLTQEETDGLLRLSGLL